MVISRSKKITVQHVMLLIGGIIVAALSFAAIFVAKIRTPVFESLTSEIPWAGYLHIVPGSIALVLGAILLSRRIRRKQIWVHRVLGYVYVVCVLLGTLGALVGSYASPSPWFIKLAFVLLGLLWPLVTLTATPLDDMFDRQTHGRVMKISYALTFSAVTLRVYLAALLACGFSFVTAYAFAAWGGFLGNLAFALITTRPKKSRLAKSV